MRLIITTLVPKSPGLLLASALVQQLRYGGNQIITLGTHTRPVRSLCNSTFCDNFYGPEIKKTWVPKSALVDLGPGPILADIRAGAVPTDAGYNRSQC